MRLREEFEPQRHRDTEKKAVEWVESSRPTGPFSFPLFCLLCVSVSLWFNSSSFASDTDRFAPVDRLMYQAIKPVDSEMRWKEVPWMQDLDAAVKQAKKEKRPLFIWVSGDEPLERC
jgi:hypothetical protein